MRARQRPRNDAREGPRLLERVTPGDRYDDVDPVGAARLRKAFEPNRVENLPHEQRHPDRVVEAGVVGRVEVEEHRIRTIRTIGAREPRVQIDTAHVGHPEKGQRVIDERVVDHPAALSVPRRCRELCRADPRRHVARRVLLKEVLALDPVRKSASS